MEPHEIAFYERLAREHRGTPRQVGAWSLQSQRKRFEVLLDVVDSMLGGRLPGLSILDLGCGKGDFAAYLVGIGRLATLHYTGIDAVEANIEDARRLGPYDFRFMRWDGHTTLGDEPFDLIVFQRNVCHDQPGPALPDVPRPFGTVAGRRGRQLPHPRARRGGLRRRHDPDGDRGGARRRGPGRVPGAGSSRLPAPRLHPGSCSMVVLSATHDPSSRPPRLAEQLAAWARPGPDHVETGLLRPLLVETDNLGHLLLDQAVDGAATGAAILQRSLGLALQPAVCGPNRPTNPPPRTRSFGGTITLYKILNFNL